MAKVELQIAVSTPPARALKLLLELQRRPEFDPTVLELIAPDGPAGEGTIFQGDAFLSGVAERFEGSITALERDRFVGFGFSYANGARLHEEWRLQAVPSGSLIRYHAQLSLPGGLFGRLLDAVMVGSGFRKQRDAVLAQVKATMDAE